MRGQVIKDHFASQVLASNPLGDPAERDLLVYLPPGYEHSPRLRYPVVFALAGYSEIDASLENWLPFQPTLSDRLDLLTAQGLLGAGLIVVMPDCFTAYGGSQYVNSPAVGPYDDYLGSGTLLVHRTDHIKIRMYFLLSSAFPLIENGIFKEKPLTCLLVHA